MIPAETILALHWVTAVHAQGGRAMRRPVGGREPREDTAGQPDAGQQPPGHDPTLLALE